MLSANPLVTDCKLTKRDLASKIHVRTTNVRRTALPGMTLLTVADLSEVRLTVYVSQTRLGEVFLDQRVDAVVDGFAERRSVGRVVRIADQPQ